MLVECLLVADDTLLVLDTAADALEENAWQALLREPLEIADAERVLETHGLPPVVTSKRPEGRGNDTHPGGHAPRYSARLSCTTSAMPSGRCSLPFDSQHKRLKLSNSPVLPADHFSPTKRH